MRLQDELRTVFKNRVEGNQTTLVTFMTVLKCLQPAITAESDLVEWFNLALKPFTTQLGASRASLEDAQDFAVGAMLYDDEALDTKERMRTSVRLSSILIDAYVNCTAPTPDDSHGPSLQAQSQAAQQLQSYLVAFGRKKAKVLSSC